MKALGRSVFLCLVVFGPPVLLWLWWGLYGIRWFATSIESDASERLGQIGDIFGGVNALFAAFAFAGVAVAAFFQFRTNELQKRSLTISSLEPLLFHLLDMHEAVYSRLQLDATMLLSWQFVGSHTSTPKEVAGLFRVAASQSGFPPVQETPLLASQFEPLLHTFDQLYLKNEDQLGPYYRAMYHVFNLIDKSELTDAERIRYANIARSTLNKDELLLLMLNCSRPRGIGFKRLVENYGLLKHISTDESSNALDHALANVMFHANATRSADERERATGRSTSLTIPQLLPPWLKKLFRR